MFLIKQMALLLGNIHNIFISGNLKRSNTISVLLPYDDIKTNLWQLKINDIAVDFKEAANLLAGISTNFVIDTKFNEQNQIVNYFPILTQIILKGSASEKKVYRLESSWYYVKNCETEIKFHFNPYVDLKVSKKLIAVDCDVFITAIMQRVK